MDNKYSSEYIDIGDPLVTPIAQILTQDIITKMERFSYVHNNQIKKSILTKKIKSSENNKTFILKELNNLKIDISSLEKMESIVHNFWQSDINKFRNVYFVNEFYHAYIHVENKNIPKSNNVLAIKI